MNPEEQRTSCPGFLDEYGNWNNGFECPPLLDRIHICCGMDSRRYCCSIEDAQISSSSLFSRSVKSSMSSNATTFSFFERLNLTFLTIPTLFTSIFIAALVLLSILIILLIFYRYRKSNEKQPDERPTTKQTLLVDHFPFSPPHHQLYFNENHSRTDRSHLPTKDSLATTTTSPSSSARMSSDVYPNDWKEFFTNASSEQAMNLYPTVSSQSRELKKDSSHLYSNYLLRIEHQSNDIIV